MRSDLILSLAHAGISGDTSSLQRTVRALAEEASAKQQHTLAKRFTSLIEGRGMRFAGEATHLPVPDSIRGLVHATEPHRRLSDLVLPPSTLTELKEVLEEHRQTELLRSYSMEPRHTMLLVGPPGTGKTSLAEAFATELGLPLFIVRYDAIVGSFLGETAAKLNELLEFAAKTPSVLFFDEFDAIGKERGDIHETGEIKRVVSSLLMQLDALPSHVFVVCATNHPELLDRAVWRRFEVLIRMPNPTKAQVQRWFKLLSKEIGAGDELPLDKLVTAFAGASYSDLEQFNMDVKRKIVLAKQPDYSKIFGQAVKKWSARLRDGRGQSNLNGNRSAATPDLFEQDG